PCLKMDMDLLTRCELKGDKPYHFKVNDEENEHQLSLRTVSLGAGAKDELHVVEAEALDYEGNQITVTLASLKMSVQPTCYSDTPWLGFLSHNKPFNPCTFSVTLFIHFIPFCNKYSHIPSLTSPLMSFPMSTDFIVNIPPFSKSYLPAAMQWSISLSLLAAKINCCIGLLVFQVMLCGSCHRRFFFSECSLEVSILRALEKI
uniref:Nucleophosmin n=1 Tax=Varanus komodoensis TaxID=61221 RepID=A0A8D2JDE0_VARKO